MPRNSRRAVAVVIAAMAVPVGLLAGGAVAGAATAHRTGATKIEVCGTGRALIRPHSIVLTCADYGELATKLHWTSWTAARATAVGEVSWKTATAAVPFARSRRWDHASARITLTRPVAEAGGKVLFTEARLHVTGHTPRGFMRDVTFREGPAMAAPLAPNSGPAPRSQEPEEPAASSGATTYSDIEGFWIDAGGSASLAETMAAIADAESYVGKPGAIEPDVAYSVTGWGLWQITPGDSESAYGEDYQLLDPWNNAEAALAKYDELGLSAWTTYTQNLYEPFLQSTPAATGLADPGQYEPINSAPSGTHNSSDPGSTSGPVMPSSAIKNRTTGQCMSNGGSTANSAPITQYTCNGSINQQFYSKVDSIVSAQSSDCFSDGGSTANSAPITQYPCNGSSNQGFYTVQDSNGYFTIQNANGFCLTTGGSSATSYPVTQYACNGSENQEWS